MTWVDSIKWSLAAQTDIYIHCLSFQDQQAVSFHLIVQRWTNIADGARSMAIDNAIFITVRDDYRVAPYFQITKRGRSQNILSEDFAIYTKTN